MTLYGYSVTHNTFCLAHFHSEMKPLLCLCTVRGLVKLAAPPMLGCFQLSGHFHRACPIVSLLCSVTQIHVQPAGRPLSLYPYCVPSHRFMFNQPAVPSPCIPTVFRHTDSCLTSRPSSLPVSLLCSVTQIHV